MRWQAKSTSDGRTLTVDFLGAQWHLIKLRLEAKY